MRIIISSAFILALTVSIVPGQKSEVEKAFASNRAKYTREHFAEGEDATSGYDYLFYKSGERIVSIRSIWSASWSKDLRIDDYYFDDEVSFARRSVAPKRLLALLKRGGNALLTSKEEFYFKDGKLTKWIVGGKAMSPSDPMWPQTEKQVIDQARSERDNYAWLKKGS
jgi:hypothetical protein